MLTLLRVKEVLFPNDELKVAFLQTLFDLNPANPIADRPQFDAALRNLLETASERELQLALAPFLRRAAINALQNSQTPYMQDVRNAGIASAIAGTWGGLTWEAFLEAQSKDTIHSTDIEAAALGELLGLNVLVTSVVDTIDN